MIDEETKKRIGELRETILTVKEIAKALNVSESTVKRYSSDDYDKDNEVSITSNKKKPLNESWMTKLFGEGWENNVDLMQRFFNLNRLAIETGRDLEEFFKDIDFIITQYHRYSDTPLKLYNFNLNIASSMSFVSEAFDMDLYINKIDDFIDENIFLDELTENINNIKEEYNEWQEKTNEAKETAKIYQDRNVNFMKNYSESIYKGKLEESEKKCVKLFTFAQKLAVEKQELNKTLEQLNQENLLFKEVFERFASSFPEDTEKIVEEIKNGKIQCSETTIS